MAAREWKDYAVMELTPNITSNPLGVLAAEPNGQFAWSMYNTYQDLRQDIKDWMAEHGMKYRLIVGAHGSLKLAMTTSNMILFKMTWIGNV